MELFNKSTYAYVQAFFLLFVIFSFYKRYKYKILRKASFPVNLPASFPIISMLPMEDKPKVRLFSIILVGLMSPIFIVLAMMVFQGWLSYFGIYALIGGFVFLIFSYFTLLIKQVRKPVPLRLPCFLSHSDLEFFRVS